MSKPDLILDLFRRSRGLAIAGVVLALSATVAFAAAPHPSPTTSGSPASETAEPAESPEPQETAEPPDSPEPAESPEPPESPEPADAADAGAAGQQGDHGALVSTAANMTTPTGFANHGAFVSCVAHLNATLATIDWTTVTPASCGQTTQHGASAKHGHGHGKPASAGKPDAPGSH